MLRSGLAADVTFLFDEGVGREYLCAAGECAVVNNTDGTYVYVAEPDPATVKQSCAAERCSLGELTQLGIEVVDGVQLGDRVITAGIYRDSRRATRVACGRRAIADAQWTSLLQPSRRIASR